MDLNDVRSAVTVLSLLMFVGIVVWAWSARRLAAFASAAHLPFADEQPHAVVRRSKDGV